MPGPDLHLHSCASDGTLSPSELVGLAVRVGCPAIALTDHDTTDGVAEALHAARGSSLTVLPGVELSAGIGTRTMHILGYHIDHTDVTLHARLEHLREIRIERAERIVRALARDGFRISVDDVLDFADGGSVGRAHIAQLLVASGQIASVDEAFRKLLGSAAPYYVPKQVYPPERLVSWIEEAGGVAVLAHPGLSEVDDLIPPLVRAGLVGLEAFHPAHDADTTSRYLVMAESLGLIVTGGSDYHGLDREGDSLGAVDVPERVVSDLQAAHNARISQ